jgi:hypothetical protein
MGSVVQLVVGAAMVVASAFAPYATPLFMSMGTALMASGALGVAAGLLTSKKSSSSLSSSDHKLTLQSTQESRKIVFGEMMVSGPLVLKTTTGSTKEYLHCVIPLAAHRCKECLEIWYDDTLSSASRISGYQRATFHPGSILQTADTDLVSEVPGWTTAHRGRGICYIYARLKYNSTAWPNGIKNVKVVLRGKALYDPRLATSAIASTDAGDPAVLHTNAAHGLGVGDEIFVLGHKDLAKYYTVATVPTTKSLTLADQVSGADVALAAASTGGSLSKLRWSNNFALAVLDYTLWQDGLNAHLSEIQSDYWIAAANVSDEPVSLGAIATCTADAVSDTLTLDSAVPWQSGLQVVLTSTGTLPGGVTAGKTYAWVRVTETTGQLASTKENALYGLGIDLTSAGTGTLTLSAALSCTLSTTANSVTLTDNVPRDDDDTDDSDQDAIDPQFGWATGDGVAFAQGTPPAGLSLGITYYWIRLTNASGQLAATHEDAIALTPLTLAGVGANLTLARVSQPRYTVNGQLDLANKPMDNMEKLLTAGGGVIPYVQGGYRLHAAGAQAASFDLGPSDLRDTMTIQAQPSKQDVLNALRGTFIDPTQLWASSDLPPMASAQYQAEDGGEQIYKDVELPFTTDSMRGQRLLWMMLQMARQGMTVDFPARLTAGKGSTMQIAAWDVGRLTFPALGWDAKLFRATAWKQTDDYGIDISLQEYAAECFDWVPSLAAHVDYAPNTSLANPWDVASPTGLVLASGTDVLAIRGDGTVQTRVKVTWTAPKDAYVLSGGTIEVQLKDTASATWDTTVRVAGDDTEVYLVDVTDGEVVDVRIRAVNVLTAMSSWVLLSGYTIIGKTAPPANVSAISAQQNGSTTTIQLAGVSDMDLAGYGVRYAAQGSFDWDTATALVSLMQSTLLTTTAIPPGDWTVGAKAVDTSGNVSVDAITCDIEIGSSGDIIISAAQYPVWAGSRTGLVLNELTGHLLPRSQKTALELGAALFSTFVPDPVTECWYETPELDTGVESGNVRIWGKIETALGPGCTSSPGSSLALAQRATGGEYGAFAAWLVGTLSGRYAKARAVLDLSSGVGILTGLTVTADAEPFTQYGSGVAAVGGTRVTFPKAHNLKPYVELTNQSSIALNPTYSDLTNEGVTVYMRLPADNSDVGGAFGWKTTGA